MTDWFSIRAKLLVYAGAVLIIPTLMYGALVFRTATVELEASIREQLRDEAGKVRGGLQELLAAHLQNVRTWAHLDFMRELVVGDVDKSVSRFLEDAKNDYGVFLDLFVFDHDGVCRATSSPGYLGRRDSEVFGADASAETSAPVEFRPTAAYSAEHRAQYLSLAVSVPDPDRPGVTLGILRAMLDLAVLHEIIHPDVGHGHVDLRLVDKDGNTITGPDPEDRHKDADPIEAAVQLVSHRVLPDLGWQVVAATERSVALAPVTAVRNRILLYGSCATLIGLGMAWFLSSSIAAPINRLTRITSRIADQGRLERIPDPTTNDEVGRLTLSFQKMVDNVSAAHEEVVRSAKLASLGEIAAGIAHEIRTPLGIVKSSAQLIERRAEVWQDSEALEFSRFIREETDRLNSVVTEMLDLARPVPASTAPTDINKVVRRVVRLCEAEAASKKVSLAASLADGLPEVSCDADQMHQAFLNLVINAVQVCEAGHSVDVSTHRANGGDTVEIRITDSGPGLDSELADDPFAPFTTKREGGVGLGLAVVKRIIDTHGGSVSASNRPEGGALFSVRLDGISGSAQGTST